MVLFSSSSTSYGKEPNEQASYVDLGMPGTLPVLNQGVIKKAVQFGLAINSKISKKSIFARKNYFYPDLPKNYQISQLDHPIVQGGYIEISDSENSIKNDDYQWYLIESESALNTARIVIEYTDGNQLAIQKGSATWKGADNDDNFLA